MSTGLTYTQSITGRSGTITLGDGTGTPVAVAITGWTATVHREYADATDSNNFDPATYQTWTTNAAGVVGMELTIEGNYDTSGSTDQDITQKFLSDPPVGGWPTTLSMVRTGVWCTLGIVLTDCEFTVTVPGATMVTFSIQGKSQGVAVFTGLAALGAARTRGGGGAPDRGPVPARGEGQAA